jgi:ribonuclease D
VSDSPAPAYLDSADAVARFMATVSDARDLALDTEGASFHRFVDRIYLLQLSTREHSSIIDPLPTGALPELGRMVEDPKVQVVFHDADYDLRLLRQDYGWKVTNVFDTRVAAQLLGYKAFGLAALLEKFFDVKLDKKHQRADWSMRPLTAGMLDYAAQDTRFLLDLRDRMRDELLAKDRLGWAQEEFTRLEAVQWAEDDSANAFFRVKGARDLTRRELALLRELVPWRDGVAREMDRSTFRVVSNDVLLEAARQAPTTREALGAIKGMPRGILESRGDDILAAIARGVAVPEADLPRFPRAPRWDRDPDFDDKVSRLKAVRDAAAARLDLDPGVLCSRDRMETIVRKSPTSIEDLLTVDGVRRWQADLLGAGFLSALRTSGPAAGAAAPPEAPVAAADPAPNEDEASPYRDG